MKNEKMKYRIMAMVVTLSVLLSYAAVFVTDTHAVTLSQYVESANFYYLGGTELQTRTIRIYDDGPGSDTSVRVGYYTTFEFDNKHGKGKIYRTHLYGDHYFNSNYKYEYTSEDNDLVYSISGGIELLTINEDCFSDIYRFSDKQSLDDYILGKTDASTALNYESVMFGSASYDASVPAPDKLYINSLSSSAVNSVWQYTDTTVDLSNVTYKVEVEDFYMSSSLFNSIAKGYTGKNGESSWKFNGTIDACNRLKGMSTVETYLSAPTQLLADQVLVSGEVMTDSGVMHTTNTYICKPTDYSGQFASSRNAFFTGASNSHWVEYCGSQITVTPYMEVDGVMKKGSTCVARRFTNDILNTLVGSTYTKIAEDSEGGEYIESSNNQDATGNESGFDMAIDSNSILKYTKDGFNLLGKDGYLTLMASAMTHVPTYIWVLIAAIVAIYAGFILFKLLAKFL